MGFGRKPMRLNSVLHGRRPSVCPATSGKWSFEDWNGKEPTCEFEDKCKDIECGEHGFCNIQEEVMQSGAKDAGGKIITATRMVAKCMCTGGWRGDKCETAPPMKCDFQIRYSNDHPSQQAVSASMQRQLMVAAQGVVQTYKSKLDSDSSTEKDTIRALLTRSSQLQNVKVCCAEIRVEQTVGKKRKKKVIKKVGEEPFETNLDNIRITTGQNSIEAGIQELMKAADLELRRSARKKLADEGVEEQHCRVLVRSVSADIKMPVGLPPEGGCLQIAN